MRIPIREQLALLILLASLISLAVISIATWVLEHNLVLAHRASTLALTASLKAAQLASDINLMQTTADFITTRIVIQQALSNYRLTGNNTAANWADADVDMAAVIGGGSAGSVGQSLLLQTKVFPATPNGPAGSAPLLHTTGSNYVNQVALPYTCPDGAQVYIGTNASECGGLDYGYPPSLYPNLTYSILHYNSTLNIPQAHFGGVVIGPEASNGLVLGPWQVNDELSLLSMTIPMINTTSSYDVLGFLTAVMNATLIQQVLTSGEGLGASGETLVVGPASATNLFPNGILYDSNHGNPPEDFEVRYVTPLNKTYASRHPSHVLGTSNLPFAASRYPAVETAVTIGTGQIDNSGAILRGRDEAGSKVSSGYAMPQTNLVDWIVLVEETRSEVWSSINKLRDTLVACVFATAGFMAIIAYPMAHFASLPIRRLREATAKSVEAPGAEASRSSFDSFETERDQLGHRESTGDIQAADGAALASKEGYKNPVSDWRQKRRVDREFKREQRRKRAFRIPGKVKERKHLVKDELSDLTTTFNEMSDELMMQYSRLEERVQQRTAELEVSKAAAEKANESKTLFIANISHELKTPLNGILGMAALCMQEDDPVRLKRSLGIIYRSGDLLLNLLTDLLTFSKNQVGQHLSLDEKEFRLRDISSQLLAIFDKQAKDGQIDLRVEWDGVPERAGDKDTLERTDLGPNGTGRVKDMVLWGDVQRILQVLINLVSNALKFTPSSGSVVLTIRCLPDIPDNLSTASRKGSSASKQSRQSRQSRGLSTKHKGSDTTLPTLSTPPPLPTLAGLKMDTANAINAKDRPNGLSSLFIHERAASPPPGNYLYFEFEITDTGPGIPDDLQAQIFEPFVQGDLGLSKKFGGTGLGLSICSQLASLMRGTVGVKSTVGAGSTFTMKIPLRHLKTRADSSASSRVDLTELGMSRQDSTEDVEHTPARHSRHLAGEDGTETKGVSTPGPPTPTVAESQPRLIGLSQPFFASSQPMESPGSQPAAMEKMTAEATRSGNRLRVLVAEDNKVNQEVVLRMLKLEDIYDVTVAKDGQEALDMVKESMSPTSPDGSQKEQKPFNLIFMDVQMPNVDGLQSTRLIREIGYQAPIVALTAFAEESNIKDCLDSGMNYFL